MSSKKVAVSACLLGHKCRYDGGDKKDESLQLEGYEVIPFCPEDAILGTPRETIDIVEGRAIGNESGVDYTQKIEAYAKEFIKTHPDISSFIVKSKSPSCALLSARYYDRAKRLQKRGEGIFTKTIQQLLKDINIIEKG